MACTWKPTDGWQVWRDLRSEGSRRMDVRELDERLSINQMFCYAYQRLSTLGPTNSYMFSTYASLYGNNLRTTKTLLHVLDPPHMERETLKSRGLNSKSSP